jgi:hypothetical protein
MIVVKVELWSAIDGSHTELARAVIDNIGGTNTHGNYRARAMRGRDEESLHASMRKILLSDQGAVHEGKVMNHPRLSQHVWNLVAKSLTAMGYK